MLPGSRSGASLPVVSTSASIIRGASSVTINPVFNLSKFKYFDPVLPSTAIPTLSPAGELVDVAEEPITVAFVFATA